MSIRLPKGQLQKEKIQEIESKVADLVAQIASLKTQVDSLSAASLPEAKKEKK